MLGPYIIAFPRLLPFFRFFYSITIEINLKQVTNASLIVATMNTANTSCRMKNQDQPVCLPGHAFQAIASLNRTLTLLDSGFVTLAVVLATLPAPA